MFFLKTHVKTESAWPHNSEPVDFGPFETSKEAADFFVEGQERGFFAEGLTYQCFKLEAPNFEKKW